MFDICAQQQCSKALETTVPHANDSCCVWQRKAELDMDVSVAVEAFVDTDKQYLQVDDGTNRDDGCTAVTAVLVKQHLVVANVGDSRAVLSRRGKGDCGFRRLPLCILF